MRVLVYMYNVQPKTLSKSIPLYIWRFVTSIKPENRKNYILLFNSAYADAMHKLLPDFEYAHLKLPYDGSPLRHLFRSYRAQYFKRKTDAVDCDVLFNAVDSDQFSYLASTHKRVIVIHDLKGIKNGGSITRKLFYNFYRNSIKNADAVIAISAYTKDDILKYYPGTNPDKIHVIYNSVPFNDTIEQPEGFDGGKEFILNVNTLLPHKNPLTLLKAYNLIKDKTVASLVMVGRRTKYWDDVLMPFIEENALTKRVVRLQDVSDSELHYLYKKASLFVTPSLHEGFGYTPIEAAMFGCPVLSSKCEALPDSTQGLLNYYDSAMDEDELSTKILSLLNNPPNEDRLCTIAEKFKSSYAPEIQREQIEQLFCRLER